MPTYDEDTAARKALHDEAMARLEAQGVVAESDGRPTRDEFVNSKAPADPLQPELKFKQRKEQIDKDLPEPTETRLKALQTLNRDAFEVFQKAGGQIDPGALIMMRLDLLINELLPEGAAQRVRFDLAYEEWAHSVLIEGIPAIRRAALLQGVQQQAPAAENVIQAINRFGKDGE